jgi:hypothetical protein
MTNEPGNTEQKRLWQRQSIPDQNQLIWIDDKKSLFKETVPLDLIFLEVVCINRLGHVMLDILNILNSPFNF